MISVYAYRLVSFSSPSKRAVNHNCFFLIKKKIGFEIWKSILQAACCPDIRRSRKFHQCVVEWFRWLSQRYERMDGGTWNIWRLPCPILSGAQLSIYLISFFAIFLVVLFSFFLLPGLKISEYIASFRRWRAIIFISFSFSEAERSEKVPLHVVFKTLKLGS